MILYHGSPEKIVTPTFGLGDERHDYGKGFYLTADLELAKEWAVCRPETESGYVHTFDFDTKDLFIFDYEKAFVRDEFNAKYNERDSNARIKMKELIDSDRNMVEKVFSTLVQEIENMNAYPECYVNEIVETQGKLFELVADTPSVDFVDFIEKYMTGKTRAYLDRTVLCSLAVAEEYFQQLPCKNSSS